MLVLADTGILLRLLDRTDPMHMSHDARLVAFTVAYGLAHILTLNPGDFARFPGIIALTPARVIATSP
jgi:hypothetical protein